MTSNWRRISLLLGEYLLLALLLIGLVVIDNRFIHHGGSILSLLAPVILVCTAYMLAQLQLPGRGGIICFFISLPAFLYAWMLGFLFTGGGI